MRPYNFIFKFFVFLTLILMANAQGICMEKEKITLLMGVSNSYIISNAITDVLKVNGVPDRFEIYYFSDKDLETGEIDDNIVRNSGIIIVDDMHSSLTKYVIDKADLNHSKIYGLCSTPKEPEKIISDPEIKKYHSPDTRENIRNMLLYILNRDCGLDVKYEKARNIPTTGIFHPDSEKIFSSFDEYLSWYRETGLYKKDACWIGVPEMSTYVFPGETCRIVGTFIKELEKNHYNVLPIYSFPSYLAVEKFFFNEHGDPRVNLITAFSFKFSSVNDIRMRNALLKLDVPVLDPIRMYVRTIDEWEKSPEGLGPIEVSFTMSVPEFNGVIEPTVLGGRVATRDERTGKTVYSHYPIKENMDFFIKRINAWRNLQVKPDKDKKIAIIYWNHTPGKQNVGATYLNLFRSLEEILRRMNKDGYSIKEKLPSEEKIKELVLKGGRNIGSWAPGELDELIASNMVIKWPVSEYKKYYMKLDESYRNKIEAEWGKVEDSDIMIKDGEIIFPCVNMGNVILMPQPPRGWGDDPMKLYHSTQLWPHHQYTAFYLWLKNVFGADAMISLGTHGTHEWLPGKQTGLSQTCPPEILINDIPNIYPYIMDNIGEGLQAKRRGRGVIIDYLIPSMKKAGIYEEYRDLSVLINEYNDALKRSVELANEKLKRIDTLVKTLGLDKDLLLDDINEETVDKIEHYLIEVQEANVPYGMHTLGVSPEGEALEEFGNLIMERTDDMSPEGIRKGLSSCYLELDRLMDGLSGKYIPSAEGNDPLRNPDAIPTGNNFYGFNPAKVPSKDSYEIGRKQAEEMIRKYLDEKGKYPDKIGLVLWSIELQRNEGTQVGTILHLLGMKPVWDKNNKVTGVEPIPGHLLGRPRIDVHIQSSGLFRDSYPNVILLLDDAVRQASQLTDVENFIAKHNTKIKAALLEKGFTEKDAETMSKIRVFSARPGSYGPKIEDLVPNSGLWENDKDIADAFINFVSFGYGRDMWGKPLEETYRNNLKDVKVTMHTRSSNLFGVLDADGTYGYLGGLSLAVKNVSGEYPDVVLSDQRNPESSHIEDIERTIGEEMRSRYLNPKWIKGMKKEDYAGARQIEKYVEYLWGWQVTTPFAVDKTKWEQTYEVYVEDKYGLDIKEFFNRVSPWAYQSVTARILEAVRKEYWNAEEKVVKKLAAEYAVSVVEKGVACCDHTCNNPMLNKMVLNIISLPGVLSPEMAEKFKIAIEKATSKDLDKNAEERKELLAKLAAVPEIKKENASKNQDESKSSIEKIEGYKMEDMKSADDSTELTSSGMQWAASLFILFIIALFFWGSRKKKH